jgi:hypothetical protein
MKYWIGKSIRVTADGRETFGTIKKFIKKQNVYLISFEINDENDYALASLEEIERSMLENTPIVA